MRTRARALALLAVLLAPLEGPAAAPPADPDWHIPLAPPDAGPSQAPDAVRLRAAVAEYRAIADAGGWPLVSGDSPPRPGERAERVIVLRERLRASGDFAGLPGTADAWFFDAGLKAALTRFQERHGLPGTGEVDARTLAALNVPAAARAAQLAATLTRWDWLPRELGPRYLWANVPTATLELVENGVTTLSMRMIAGHPARPTPSFTDTISQVVVNPAWSVPRTIAVEDMLPSQREDPQYLERLRIHVYDQEGRELDPAAIDWRKVGTRPFPYRFRQEPGPQNSLGRLKFVLHNPWDIFLHDTPSRRLFELNNRTLSSGCLRLQAAEELAQRLMAGAPDAGALAAALAGTRTRTLTLPEPITVYVVYLATWVSPEGVVNFRPDVYGRDARLR